MVAVAVAVAVTTFHCSMLCSSSEELACERDGSWTQLGVFIASLLGRYYKYVPVAVIMKSASCVNYDFTSTIMDSSIIICS